MNCVNLLAYVDPGSGTLLLQVILASLVGGLFTLRTWIAGCWLAWRVGKRS